MDLKWTPPREDGGAPIEGYIVEKKDKFGNWEKALEVPADKTTATVPDLIEGQTYEFRFVVVPWISMAGSKIDFLKLNRHICKDIL